MRAESKAALKVKSKADHGVIPQELQNKISAETDIERLKKWLKLASRVETIEEFVAAM